MELFVRKDPNFSLCGLNCCLCPRFHTEGASRCPGCGGPGFADAHPTCAVATCNRKRDKVEYCFKCGSYPCEKYKAEGAVDSFISYRRVRENLAAAKADLAAYLKSLQRRSDILQVLLTKCNDGKSKGLYCLVANDMPLADLEGLLALAESLPEEWDAKKKAAAVKEAIKASEGKVGFSYKLRAK